MSIFTKKVKGMEEPKQTQPFEDYALIHRIPVLSIWAILLLVCIFGALISSGLSYLLAIAFDMELTEALASFDSESPAEERYFFRLLAMINQLCTFLLPGLLVVVFLVQKEWMGFLKIKKFPAYEKITWCVIFLIAVFPFAQFTYWLNHLIPLPEWAVSLEGSTETMINGFLVMENIPELVSNLVVIAVIPAIGEELIFRGIIQQTLLKIYRHHLAIWLAAVVFSFIHFQFEGFLPRMVLGAALGYIFFWTGNLWVPIIVHMFNNGLQVLAAYWYREEVIKMEPENLTNVNIMATVISIIVMAVVAYYLHFRKAPHWQKEEEHNEKALN